ncbi:MAG: hypothetical protein ACI91B_000611 [Planctomycetota bacterium]|jgi:hypothetical protein
MRFFKVGPQLLVMALLFTACHTPSTPDLALAPAGGGIRVADFPAPRHLLRGFDKRQPKGPWLIGDEVLFGLRLSRDGEERHWLLQLRVLEVTAIGDDGKPLDPVDWALRINGEVEEFESAVCRAEVVVMDEHGTELGRSQPLLPRDFLNSGIAGACKLARRQLRQSGQVSDRYESVDMRTLAEATVSAVALLQVVQEDSVLAPILWQVIEKPTVWSVVSNMGVTVMMRPSFHRVTSALSPVPTVIDQTWRLPIALEVNETPALNLELFVTESSPPFSLAGGMLGATARHPTNPTLEVSLLLLSARRNADAARRPE